MRKSELKKVAAKMQIFATAWAATMAFRKLFTCYMKNKEMIADKRLRDRYKQFPEYDHSPRPFDFMWYNDKLSGGFDQFGNYKTQTDDVLGYDVTDEGKITNWVLTTKQDVMQLNGNRCIICGSDINTSTRKHESQLMTDALQAIRRGESIIVRDPKGKMYEKLKVLCEKNGYDVKQFNVESPKNSDGIDVIKEILPISHDDDYEKKIYTTCGILATSIMQNTYDSRAKPGDVRWNEIVLSNWHDTIHGIIQMELYRLATAGEKMTFSEFINDIQPLDAKALEKLRSNLSATDLAQIGGSVPNFGKDELDDVRERFWTLFGNAEQQAVLANQEMDLAKPGSKKCAYFVITPGIYHQKDFIVALFYELIFRKLTEAADAREDGSLPVRVNFLMDEFSSRGKFVNFEDKLATLGKRNISITIVLENFGSLLKAYPKENWDDLIDACDEIVYLGGRDIDAMSEYLANRIVLNEVSEQMNDIPLRVWMESEERRKEAAEYIRNLPKDFNMVIIKHMRPILTGRVDYKENPLAKEISEYSATKHVPKWLREKCDELWKHITDNHEAITEDEDNISTEGKKEGD